MLHRPGYIHSRMSDRAPVGVYWRLLVPEKTGLVAPTRERGVLFAIEFYVDFTSSDVLSVFMKE
jgi:hypothetical protein